MPIVDSQAETHANGAPARPRDDLLIRMGKPSLRRRDRVWSAPRDARVVRRAAWLG